MRTEVVDSEKVEAGSGTLTVKEMEFEKVKTGPETLTLKMRS